MNKKDIISNLLLNKSGAVLFPKPEGEIEVPNLLKVKKEIGIGIGHGEIIISNRNIFEMKAPIVNDKIIIPKVMLTQAKLQNKQLTISTSGDLIILRADNLELQNQINDFIGSLSEVQKTLLIDCLLANKSDIKFKIEKQEEPYLFLLNKKEFIFRPVGLPFKFSAFFDVKNGELLLNENGNPYYMISGINRNTRNVGYLLLNEFVFSKVVGALKRKEMKCIDNDLIFYYSPSVDGDFKIYLDPYDKIEDVDIKKINKICNNVDEFIKNTFNAGKPEGENFVSSLTRNLLSSFKNKPEIE